MKYNILPLIILAYFSVLLILGLLDNRSEFFVDDVVFAVVSPLVFIFLALVFFRKEIAVIKNNANLLLVVFGMTFIAHLSILLFGKSEAVTLTLYVKGLLRLVGEIGYLDKSHVKIALDLLLLAVNLVGYFLIFETLRNSVGLRDLKFSRFAAFLGSYFLGWLGLMVLAAPFFFVYYYAGINFYFLAAAISLIVFFWNLISAPVLMNSLSGGASVLENFRQSLLLGRRNWKDFIAPCAILFFLTGAYSISLFQFVIALLERDLSRPDLVDLSPLQQIKLFWMWGGVFHSGWVDALHKDVSATPNIYVKILTPTVSTLIFILANIKVAARVPAAKKPDSLT